MVREEYKKDKIIVLIWLEERRVEIFGAEDEDKSGGERGVFIRPPVRQDFCLEAHYIYIIGLSLVDVAFNLPIFPTSGIKDTIQFRRTLMSRHANGPSS